jgi:hypothetical protein
MTARQVPSTLPVLLIIVAAVVSLVQLLAPGRVPPGLMLFLVGVVFLILYFAGWVREALTLDTGWLLAGFGLAFWAADLPALSQWHLELILLGLGAAFVAIYITNTLQKAGTGESRYWSLVPGVLLLAVGTLLVFENVVGRERLWNVVVPVIPTLVAIWYIIEWRRGAVGAGR